MIRHPVINLCVVMRNLLSSIGQAFEAMSEWFNAPVERFYDKVRAQWVARDDQTIAEEGR